MTVNPTNDLSHVDIEKEQLEGRANEFDKSLVNYRRYNRSISYCNFYQEDRPRSIALSSVPHYSVDYSKIFDKKEGTIHYYSLHIYDNSSALVQDARVGS